MPPGVTPLAIAEDGFLCGYYSDCENGSSVPHAFSWDGKTFSEIVLHPARPHGKAYAVNSSKQIAGTMLNATSGSTMRAFIHHNGVTVDLGTFGGSGDTEAFAINESGVVVGYSQAADGQHAFRWEKGVLSDLELPVGPHNRANDVNELGQIVGWMGSMSVRRAIRWDSGFVTELQQGALSSEAFGINNKGDVVGASYEATANGNVVKAVMWRKDGKRVELGVLPGFVHARALQVNDDGVIIGYCFNTPPPTSFPGFVWQDGVMSSLSSLTTHAALDVGWATDINNNGEMSTFGSLNGAVGVLLTPIPGFPGDYNCDKTVDLDDLMGVINHWGVAGGASAADFDQNKDVDVDDLLAVINNWGPVEPSRAR